MNIMEQKKPHKECRQQLRHGRLGTFLVLVQLTPYIGYMFFLENFVTKNIWPDSFRYLWEQGSVFAFITNSSLSVRVLYSLLDSNIGLICCVQLAFVAISQIAIYRVLCNGRLSRDLPIALILIILFASHNSKWMYNIAMSDSLFTSLYFLFIAAVCMYSDQDSSYKKSFSCFIVVLFIFSRNPAPYIAIFTCTGVFLVRLIFRQKTIFLTVATIFLSIIAIISTSAFDTTTELNVTQNILKKVFPDKEKTRFFHEKYDMPVGPFVDICKGGTVNSLCFNYQRIQSGSTYTRTYKVTFDSFGFADWVREKGMQSWQHYLLVENFGNTMQEFASQYQIKFTNLFKQPPSNRWGGDHWAQLDTFDPFRILGRLFTLIQLDNAYSLIAMIIISMACYIATGLKNEFLFTGTLITSGIAMTFIGYFGDVGSDRQVYPGIYSIYIGQLFFIFLQAELILKKIHIFIKKPLIPNK